jgi:hypothetical protein
LVFARVFLELSDGGIEAEEGVLAGEEEIIPACARTGFDVDDAGNRKDEDQDENKDGQDGNQREARLAVR